MQEVYCSIRDDRAEAHEADALFEEGQRGIMYEERFAEPKSDRSDAFHASSVSPEVNTADSLFEDSTVRDTDTQFAFSSESTLFRLWDEDRQTAGLAARALYAQSEKSDRLREETETALIEEFLYLLYALSASRPVTVPSRLDIVTEAALQLVRTIQSDPRLTFLEERAAFALRPIGRLSGWWRAEIVCDLLYDLYRGLWAPHLTKPQIWSLRDSIALALAALPPETLLPLWNGLQRDDGLRRGAMMMGIELLNGEHAVAALVFGLGYSRDHMVRSLVVNYLEQIGDASCLPRLAEVRRETAYFDWTLSRQIARAMRIIERSSQGSADRILLRPADAPSDLEYMLLRATAEAAVRPDILLRPSMLAPDETSET